MKKITILTLSLLFVFNLLQAQRDYTVHFEGHDELFESNAEAQLLAKPNADEIFAGYFVRYLQFEDIPNAKKRARLEQNGLEFLEYVSYGAYLVAIPTDFDLTSLESESLRSVQPVLTDWKINLNLQSEYFEPWAYKGQGVQIIVKIYPFADLVESAIALQQEGYKATFLGKQGHWLQITAPESDFEKIAQMNFVHHIELTAPPAEPDDTRGRALHRSNMINSDAIGGKKYDGTGIGVLVRDDGDIGPHIDFQGRLTDFAVGEVGDTHGDGVAGILAGAGNLNPNRKGMATGSDIFNINYVNHFEDITLPLHLDEGVKVTNSSYSDGCNDGYTSATRTVDRQIFENPTLLHVFSAGNSGTSNCGYGAGNQWGNITGGHKQAKNCIATANLGQDLGLAPSSSKGPAHDGRIKPDIAANGLGHVSTDPNNVYSTFGGTSAAAPGIAGITAQLMHAYRELSGGGEAPSALIKAALLNTANDLGNIGPDFTYGWGHVNSHRALGVLEQNNYWLDTLDQDGVYTQTITVPSGQKTLKFMTYWAEQNAAVNASIALINDLDMIVISPNGDTLLPWILDPTPSVAAITSPATRGEDHLNNVEQVVDFQPIAGDYTIVVRGNQVPMGPQEFYIIYDAQNTTPTLTYPNGGEGIAAGEQVRIHWDAEYNTSPIELDYSLDNGASWLDIATVSASTRFHDWSAPDVAEGGVRVRISIDGQSDMSDHPFSIVRVPSLILITKVCPDSMYLRIVQAVDSLDYNIYLLGEKYMELRGKSETGMASVAITNPADEMWVAVRPTNDHGVLGPQTTARRHPGGLLNCDQAIDLTVSSLVEPSQNAINSCEPVERTIKIEVQNVGSEDLTGATASYQLGNYPIFTENISDLAVGSDLVHEFSTPMLIDTNGVLSFKAWVDIPGDLHGANDTIRADWTIITQASTTPLAEDFEMANLNFPPINWGLDNPDNAITWMETSAISSTSGSSTVAYMNFYDYSMRGEEDALVPFPMDISGYDNPALSFDLAYSMRVIPGRDDALRIEAYPACDLTATPVVIYRKVRENLATNPNSPFSAWEPTSSNQWRTDLVSLKGLGDKIALRFVGENDWGNNLYLDNINLIETEIEETVAGFSLSQNSICVGESIDVSDFSTGEDLTYNWSFGQGANPATARTAGPHTVTYANSSGTKQVQLILGGAGGMDTLNFSVEVIGLPDATFTVDAMNQAVNFTNSTSSGVSYLWDFGDGNTSTDANPTHTYAVDGTYMVTLTATNACGEEQYTEEVNVQTVGVNQLSDAYRIAVLPNPTSGIFNVSFKSPNQEAIQLLLHDVLGRLVEHKNFTTAVGVNHSLQMGSNALANGVYSLTLRSNEGEKKL